MNSHEDNGTSMIFLLKPGQRLLELNLSLPRKAKTFTKYAPHHDAHLCLQDSSASTLLDKRDVVAILQSVLLDLFYASVDINFMSAFAPNKV